MSAPVSPDDLRRLIAAVEDALGALPPLLRASLPPARWRARQGKHARAVAALSVDLEQAGVRTSFGAGGVCVTAGGISATSAAGTEGALRTWVAAARLRLATEGAE